MAQENKFTLRQGFAGDITITIKDADGNALNITGTTVYFMMKNKKSDTDANALISKDSAGVGGVALTTPASGVITVSFTQAETAALTKNCTAEVVIKYSTTNVTKTKDIAVTLDKSIKIDTV